MTKQPFCELGHICPKDGPEGRKVVPAVVVDTAFFPEMASDTATADRAEEINTAANPILFDEAIKWGPGWSLVIKLFDDMSGLHLSEVFFQQQIVIDVICFNATQ